MFNIFLSSFTVSFAEQANTFIHFLIRIPFLGKKIPESLYKKTKAKIILGVVRYILGLIFELFRKSLYLFVFVVFPSAALINGLGKNLDRDKLFIYIFILISYIAGSLINSIFQSSTDKAYNMIALMRVNAKKYYLGQFIYKIISDSIFLSPVMIMHIGFRKTIIVLSILAIFRMFGESITLLVFKRFKFVIFKALVAELIIYSLALTLAYLLPFFNIILDPALILEPIPITIILVLGVLSLIYLVKSNTYNPLSKTLLSREAIFNNEEAINDLVTSDIKLDETDVAALDSSMLNNKSGFDYLNSIFFTRHRKIVKKAITIRVLIIIGATVVGGVLLLIFPQHKENVATTIMERTSYLIFLTYMISTTQRICKAMFFNCDISLLRYSYYKSPKAILENFKVRLKKVVSYDLISGSFICIGLVVIMIVCERTYNIVDLIPVFISVLGLSCFFSIYHLFMYYIVQPYTKSLTIQSPLFYIANFIIYLLCYQSINLTLTSSWFSVIVIGITVIFIPIALFTIYKISPKTFKLK